MYILASIQLLVSIAALYAVYRTKKTLERRINSLPLVTYEQLADVEGRAIDAQAHVYRVAQEAREQIQASIIRAFQPEQMAQWAAASAHVATAQSLGEIARRTVPALKDMKPGPMNWTMEVNDL